MQTILVFLFTPFVLLYKLAVRIINPKTVTGYYITRGFIFGLWLNIAVHAWIYMFAPLIAAYGFWPLIGTLSLFTIGANVTSFAYFFTTKPTKAQATPRPPYPGFLETDANLDNIAYSEINTRKVHNG